MGHQASSDAIAALVEAGCLPSDPVPWLLASDEPWAVFATLTAVLGTPAEDGAVRAARKAVIGDSRVHSLVERLSEPSTRRAGHHSPLYLPNLLNLLAAMGLRAGDDPQVDDKLETLACRLEPEMHDAGAAAGVRPASACDVNALVDTLQRMGVGADPRVAGAAERAVQAAHACRQGRGWSCAEQDGGAGVLAGSSCPQITLEGLRVAARRVGDSASPDLVALARTPLTLWRRRTDERPYEFGHGYQFKTVKWPSLWYDVLAVVDAVGPVPAVWRGPGADEGDVTAMAELAATLIAYNLTPDGHVVPTRTHTGFEQFSFGRKGAASPFATSLVLAALVRVHDLAGRIASVDAHALPASLSSTSATERREAVTASCPMPLRRSYDSSRVLPRLLARHQLAGWREARTAESVVADIVGLPSADPTAPYLSLTARMPQFVSESLTEALEVRRSLVRLRAMRGQLYAVRRDFVPIVHAVSSRQVVRYARDFARARGVDAAAYERLAEQILAALSEQPLTRRELRALLRPSVDLSAAMTLMHAERLVLQGALPTHPFDREPVWLPFEQALPDIDLDEHDEDEARPLLLRAYVRGFGPVSRKDAAWWTGMDLKRVRRSLEALEDELVEVTFDRDEEPWLMHAADAEELEYASLLDAPCVSLLPANDPLVVSYMDRSRFLDDVARRFVFDTSGNAAPVVVVDGRIAAVWQLQAPRTPDEQPTVLVFPVGPIESLAAEKLEAAAARAGYAIFGSAAEVRYHTGMRPLVGRAVGAFRHPLV